MSEVNEGSGGLLDRLRESWKEVFSLSWPVMVENVLRTLLRTTDVVVAGFFSPAAVAALGISDLYALLPLRVGQGIGSGAVALTSQDTGRGEFVARNEAVTQAFLIGILAGIPFMLVGVVLDEWSLEVLGATPEIVRLGAIYFAVIFLGTPARHTALIGALVIQGTGDTRTPMFVNTAANVFNIVGTVVLGFGLGPAPDLGIAGVGLATVAADAFTGLAFMAFIHSSYSDLDFVVPSNPVVSKQIVVISIPRVAEGFIGLLFQFPFNAMLLTFGTEVNAAYHIGRRVYQQITEPLARGYRIAATIMVGQALGRGEAEEAYFSGWSTAALAVITVGGIGLSLFVLANPLVQIFTRDPVTIGYATDFAKAFALSAALIGSNKVMGGVLRGGSETRPPFIALLTGSFVFLLGITYFFGIRLEYGVIAAYVGIVADYFWRNVVVWAFFLRRSWLVRATTMMDDRVQADAEGTD